MAFGLNDDPNSFSNKFGGTQINEQRYENITYPIFVTSTQPAAYFQ
jgi:hypothetical protein